MTIAEGVQAGKGRQATPRGPLTTGQGVSRGASLTAGMGLLVMTLLAVFANFVVLEGLVTPGDAEQTASDIAGSEGLFRWGIAALIVVVALDVVVAVALFALFAPVSRSVSQLAAAFPGSDTPRCSRWPSAGWSECFRSPATPTTRWPAPMRSRPSGRPASSSSAFTCC